MTKCQQMFPTDPSKCVEYQPEAELDIEDKSDKPKPKIGPSGPDNDNS
jgi:hypothetical protein